MTWFAVLVGVAACHGSAPTPVAVPPGPALPTARIAIVGASVSAGFGGTPFGDAFTQAARGSVIESQADVLLFRDPIGNSAKQIDAAIAFKATTIVALDFLFWDVYGSPDPQWREQALAAGLAQLERARASGAWVIVGDIPHVVTAAEWMLPRSQVPDAPSLAALNAKIVAWTQGKDHVLFVPFASWAEPLAAGGEIEIAPGEKVPATSLVAVDGLHANALGVWTLLDRLDRLIETSLPGTPKDALVFVRPKD
ncbi:MAG: hypothetical protein JWP01_3516 [Myxococcales bacterium]|nr:hypothetical protein [Myxococcales bacterium]